MSGRLLTKSGYMVATECPTKLYYFNKPQYRNQRQYDPFLAALAEGGFQVEELARRYFRDGISVEAHDYPEAEAQTAKLMERDRIVLFEPVFRFSNLLIRVDILVKEGLALRLLEVKSKSFDGAEGRPFFTKADTIRADWAPYLHDIAFQKHVLQAACPGFTVSSSLMLVDKNATCPTDGLNQKFLIRKGSASRAEMAVSSALSDQDLSVPLVREVSTDEAVGVILNAIVDTGGSRRTFGEHVAFLAEQYGRDVKIAPELGSKCSKCEFKTEREDDQAGMQSGFKECWMETLNWSEADFLEPTVLELWNTRKRDLYIASNKHRLRDLQEDDVSIKPSKGPGLSSTERQWLQIAKARNSDRVAYFNKAGLMAEVGSWQYPIHFIDFETCRVAIPFNRGRRPYEGIFFQFSHHAAYADGTVHHVGQYLNAERGSFPNYDSVRHLKSQLTGDQGTILRYASHENSILREVADQLREDPAPPEDADELCEFILSVTESEGASGMRSMVDLLELVKRYYYDPSTGGSNSLKRVLPGLIASSAHLQSKYSKPIYGCEGGIRSLNFRDWAWIRKDVDGNLVDPYSVLPPVFGDEETFSMGLLASDAEIREGGAAMIAYCRMQFSEMSDHERARVGTALLKYCELDTLAMVMLYEGWKELPASP